MPRAIVIVLAFVLTLTAGSGTEAREPAIRVLDTRWTDAIDGRTYTHVFTETAPVAPLYLWTRVAGTEEALEKLRSEGRLPLVHKWFRCASALCAFDERVLTDRVPLGTGSSDLIAPLSREIVAHGFFDWRTWSMKERLRPGTWKVLLVDAKNEPVACDEDNERCEFWIDVE